MPTTRIRSSLTTGWRDEPVRRWQMTVPRSGLSPFTQIRTTLHRAGTISLHLRASNDSLAVDGEKV
ncbi:hypothetical protein C9J85_07510 [Haloferax sp. wsp5]|nr:hypothetical protein C9J85_07510 [Haloferax sp. wsp5]